MGAPPKPTPSFVIPRTFSLTVTAELTSVPLARRRVRRAEAVWQRTPFRGTRRRYHGWPDQGG